MSRPMLLGNYQIEESTADCLLSGPAEGVVRYAVPTDDQPLGFRHHDCVQDWR